MQPLVRRAAVIRRSLIALAVAGFVASCARPGGQEQSPTPSSTPSVRPSPSASPTLEPTERPATPAILTVDQSGGLMPMDGYYAIFPPFTLLGDGRVVLLKAPIDYYSGPLVPDVRIRQLTDAGVMTVVKTAVASGQFVADARWDGMGALGLYDAGTASFTLNTYGAAVTVSVYGLGAYLDGEPPANLPADERAVHEALNQLLEQLTTIESWLPAGAWSEPASAPYIGPT